MTESAQPPDAAAGASHVLVVEDSATQRLTATHRLTALGYRVSAVADGEAALGRIAEGGVDIVLSDWMMPRLDGIALCRAVRGFADSAYVYFVLMTARSERESLAEGLAAGADDFIAKPLDPAELGARLNAGRRLAELHRRLDDARRRAETAHATLAGLYAQIQRDLAVAADLQAATLPRGAAVVNGCQVAGLCRAAGHVGGDHIGWSAIGPDAVAVYSIDVAGHGVASCLLALRLAAVLAPDAGEDGLIMRRDAAGRAIPVPPSDVVEALNAMRFGGEEHDLFFTIGYAVLQPSTGAVDYASAGHWPAAILGRDGAVRFVAHEGGPPAGLIAEARYGETRFTLAPGERLILYSDGIAEAGLPAGGGTLGETGVAALLSAVAGAATADLPAALWQTLHNWPGGMGDAPPAEAGAALPGPVIEDDASLVVIERPGRGAHAGDRAG